MAVSLTDMVRNLLGAVDAPPAEVGAVLDWLQGEQAAAWVAAHVVDTAGFRTVLKTPMSIDELLARCAEAVEEAPAGAPEEAAAVVALLQQRWRGAELDNTSDQEEDGDPEGAPPSSSYKHAATVAALNKAKQQLPMLMAVQQALAMFPEGIADRLDKQAAAVGDSVRKQVKNSGKGSVSPSDIISNVMSNPAFMDMMKTMMEQDQAAPQDEETAHRERALAARLRLIEMRLDKLEQGGGEDAPPPAPAGAGRRTRKKKGKGGRAPVDDRTPTY